MQSGVGSDLRELTVPARVVHRLEPAQAGWTARRRSTTQELPSCSGRIPGVGVGLALGLRVGGRRRAPQCRVAVRQGLAPPSRGDDDGGGVDAATQVAAPSVTRAEAARPRRQQVRVRGRCPMSLCLGALGQGGARFEFRRPQGGESDGDQELMLVSERVLTPAGFWSWVLVHRSSRRVALLDSLGLWSALALEFAWGKVLQRGDRSRSRPPHERERDADPMHQVARDVAAVVAADDLDAIHAVLHGVVRVPEEW
jgi:hypothetical protein